MEALDIRLDLVLTPQQYAFTTPHMRPELRTLSLARERLTSRSSSEYPTVLMCNLNRWVILCNPSSSDWSGYMSHIRHGLNSTGHGGIVDMNCLRVAYWSKTDLLFFHVYVGVLAYIGLWFHLWKTTIVTNPPYW